METYKFVEKLERQVEYEQYKESTRLQIEELNEDIRVV